MGSKVDVEKVVAEAEAVDTNIEGDGGFPEATAYQGIAKVFHDVSLLSVAQRAEVIDRLEAAGHSDAADAIREGNDEGNFEERAQWARDMAAEFADTGADDDPLAELERLLS